MLLARRRCWSQPWRHCTSLRLTTQLPNQPNDPRYPFSSSSSSLGLARSVRVCSAVWLLLLCVAVLILAGYTIYAVKALARVANGQPLLSNATVAAMRAQEPLSCPLANASTASASRLNSLKLVWVFMDGLRWERITSESPLRDVLASRYAGQSRLMEISSEVPTISVPNYLAQITGAAPEVHGHRGNTGVDGTSAQTAFETVFDVAARYNLSAALFGDKGAIEFWRQYMRPMRNHTRELMDGGVLPPQPPMDTYFNACAVAKAVVTGADLSLYYLEALDAMGHNTRVSNMDLMSSAVAIDLERQVAAVLVAIMELLDNQTILLVTSDHGLLDAGGHGGLEEHIRRTPLFVYRRGGSGSHPFFPERTSPLRGVDVASTVSALLGIPPPRQNHGQILPEAFSMADHSPSAALCSYEMLHSQLQGYLHAVHTESGVAPAQSALQDLVAPVNVEQLSRRLSLLARAYEEQRHGIAQLHRPWCIVAVILSMAVSMVAMRLLQLALPITESGLSCDSPLARVGYQRVVQHVPTCSQHQVVIFVTPVSEPSRVSSRCSIAHRLISLRHACVVAACIMSPAVVHTMAMLLVWLCFFRSKYLYQADAQLLWNSSQFDTPWGYDALIRLLVVSTILAVGLHALLSWLTVRTWISLEVFRIGQMWLRRRSQMSLRLTTQTTQLLVHSKLRIMLGSTIMIVGVCMAGSLGRVFFIEGWHDNPMIESWSWAMRFVVSDLLLMAIPLQVFSILHTTLALGLFWLTRSSDVNVHQEAIDAVA